MADEAQEEELRHAGIEVFGVFILLISLAFGYCYHNNPWFKQLEKFFPHASANIVFGACLGAFLAIIQDLRLVFKFNAEFFFLYLLPPIIFAAGYEIPKDFFFHNFGSIMLYAFLGTALSSFAIGGLLYAACYQGQPGMPNFDFTDNMMLGSLISAVDPVAVLVVLKTLSVDEQLKVILFGESVVNDAAAVVINRVFVGIADRPNSANEAFTLAIPLIFGIAVGSILIGTICALFFAWVFKNTELRKYPEIEISVFLLAAFVPYAIADVCHLSGIMSVLFAGVMADFYTYHHLSKTARHTTKHVVSALSNMAESFVFVYLGMAFFLEKTHDFRPGYCFLTLFLCFIGRAVSVFPLSFLLNLKRKHTIPFKHQLVFWFGGLRGPVAFALAAATPGHAHDVILTTTVFIIAVTTIGLGGLAYPYIKFVKPPVMRSTLATRTETYDISHHWFNKLDHRFLKPLFGPRFRRADSQNPNAKAEHRLENEDNMTRDSQELSSDHKDNHGGGHGTTANRVAETITLHDMVKDEETGNKENQESHAQSSDEKEEKKMDTLQAPNKQSEYSNARTQPASYLDNPNEFSHSGTWDGNPTDPSFKDASKIGVGGNQVTSGPSVSPPPTAKYNEI